MFDFGLIFRWQEALHHCSAMFGCPFIGLIKHLPEVCMVRYLSDYKKKLFGPH